MNGIDRIPLDMVKVTNKEMQQMLVTVDGDFDHVNDSGFTIDWSYVTRSRGIDHYYGYDDSANRTRVTRHPDGTVTRTTGYPPATELLDYLSNPKALWRSKQMEAMGTVKIASYPYSAIPDSAGWDIFRSPAVGFGDLPYLVVHGTGVGRDDDTEEWFTLYTERIQGLITRALDRDMLLFVAAYDRDSSGRYFRVDYSTACIDVDAGCLWVQGPLQAGRWKIGSSLSSSTDHLSGTLASVLAVFPDTAPQDLAKLAKACAKKRGDGIEKLLRVSGGTGVADFGCMDRITQAARGLTTHGTTTVDIDGKTVTVSERRLVVE